MDKNTQIRKLSPGVIFKLSQILDERGWKDVMSIIPSNPSDMSSTPKYTVEQIRLVETFAEKHSRSCTEIFLDEWGSSGRKQPTIETFLNCLIKAELFRAADYLAVDILEESIPERPSSGPAARANVNLEVIVRELEPSLRIVDDSTTIPHVPYMLLAEATNNFDETPMDNNNAHHSLGRNIGAGAFGSVFYGIMPDGKAVAVKKLKSDTSSLFQQFQTEIQTLSRYKHPNLLSLLAYSCDTQDYCLVYEFMPNRSLQDKLAEVHPQLALNWKQRLDIAIGVCQGIHYLHTASALPLIHRDVKTANILLDRALLPKLGDFGLVKVSPTDSRMTSTVFGTSAYMAPEAFRGDVSVKVDVYSFGVVLLELLTGLPPYEDSRDGADIITYVDSIIENDSIVTLLDPKATWNLMVADGIFALSQQCFKDKRQRPLIGVVLSDLNHVAENVSEA